MTTALYDGIADWYEEYATDLSGPYMDRVRSVLAKLLGSGAGQCLDLCCGTGAHAAELRRLGWTPVGVDLSGGQLRHARARLPVARADATALPLADGAVPAAVCVLAHTDMPDYPVALAEAARVLAPGGRLVHVGLHPCFCGAFADRSDPERIVIDGGYAERERTFRSWNATGVRARVGAWHLPLADLLTAVTAAGLVLDRVVESGSGPVPDILALQATRPH
ncbi:methyltransferase domain-containing protein [Micromonospora sp. WMMD1128]|uniref:class I SAM-dependent methyltransferase n=1 Tax=unclassified Micromonospora TaxID=2617518 RepID=UPI00248C0017|nr:MULTISPECIES: class I SAM-dependent methyltransferase [unclassified Micromonospora]WBB75431.1 methyltransferase domain-containing protein [Micromonospora sp. WMMD1128]WFE31178.1 methyltransferase domain-containing protein [Micromonospora sp. WMMD975]